ncbi:MAG: class I SAM-dependent methyltransferase, partial [Burkholderiales bacterium]
MPKDGLFGNIKMDAANATVTIQQFTALPDGALMEVERPLYANVTQGPRESHALIGRSGVHRYLVIQNSSDKPVEGSIDVPLELLAELQENFEPGKTGNFALHDPFQADRQIFISKEGDPRRNVEQTADGRLVFPFKLGPRASHHWLLSRPENNLDLRVVVPRKYQSDLLPEVREAVDKIFTEVIPAGEIGRVDILDVPSGQGLVTVKAVERGVRKVYALDLSRESLNQTGMAAKEAQTRTGSPTRVYAHSRDMLDLESLFGSEPGTQTKKQYFDYVISVNPTLIHYKPADLYKIFHGLKTRLRSGGQLVLLFRTDVESLRADKHAEAGVESFDLLMQRYVDILKRLGAEPRDKLEGIT